MFLGLFLSVFGCMSFALGIDRHWREVMGSRPRAPHERALLRSFGAFLFCGSITVCLDAEPTSLGVLLWAMEAMAGAGIAAAILSLGALIRRGP